MSALLEVSGLSLNYGGLRAVEDVSFQVQAGEALVLLGANGAGKTTILRCISGLLKPGSGQILTRGRDLRGMKPHQIAHAGISHVPEGRRVFGHLTVQENLLVSHIRRAGRPLAAALDHVFALFPRLAERRKQAAGTLSGGEQQALAIGRALMNKPELLMLDEPSLGLSPLLTQQVFDQLAAIRDSGISILLVEQNASCLQIATRGVVLQSGRVALVGDRQTLRQSEQVRRAYLGL